MITGDVVLGEALKAANARIAELEAQVARKNNADEEASLVEFQGGMIDRQGDLITELFEKNTAASARIRELEIELAVKESTIADLRDYNERVVAIATEDVNKLRDEYEARLAEVTTRAEVSERREREGDRLYSQIGAAFEKMEAERNAALSEIDSLEARLAEANERADNQTKRADSYARTAQACLRDAGPALVEEREKVTELEARLKEAEEIKENVIAELHKRNAYIEALEHDVKVLYDQREEARAALKGAEIVLDEHRWFHDKASCPLAPDCRVCCAEAAYAIRQAALADRIEHCEKYHSSANPRVAELEARLKEAEAARDNCSEIAMGLLGASFCDTHREKVKQLDFPAFHQWMKDMGCQACAFDRATAAEADAARLRGALEEVEWIWIGDENQNHTTDLICPWCKQRRGHPWCDDLPTQGHKPDCARQAALAAPDASREEGDEK